MLKSPNSQRILDLTTKQHSSTTAIVRGADTMLNEEGKII